jgi:hypothetical protein
VRDDRVQPCAAVDHVFHPVGCGDGVVTLPAEDPLWSSSEARRQLGVYGVGAILTVDPVLAPFASQAV